MKIVLFGLPISTQERFKAESNNWAGAIPGAHSFRSVPLTTNSNVPFTKGELEDLKLAVEDGFTHIVIPGRSDWKVVRQLFRFDCRVHSVPVDVPLREMSWKFMRTRLHEIAALDEVWVARISPTDLRHALLLPRSAPELRRMASFWRRSWRRRIRQNAVQTFMTLPRSAMPISRLPARPLPGKKCGAISKIEPQEQGLFARRLKNRVAKGGQDRVGSRYTG